MKLIEHRKIINENPNSYEIDLKSDRLVKSIVNHIRADFSNVRFDNEKKKILKEIILLLFRHKSIDHFSTLKEQSYHFARIAYLTGTLIILNMNGDTCYHKIKYLKKAAH